MSVVIEGRKVKGLVFDVDGTFYDTATQERIFAAPRVAIAEHLNTTVAAYLALAKKTGSFSNAFTQMGGTRKDYVRLSEIDKSPFLKFDRELLDMLVSFMPKVKLAILTSTTTSSLESVGRTILGPNWWNLFDVKVASDTPRIQFRKPDPRVFTETLNRLNLNANETAMIGDSHLSDILPAVLVGMLAIQVENTDSPVAHLKIPTVHHLISHVHNH